MTTISFLDASPRREYSCDEDRVAGSALDGGGFITVNNGFGLVELQVPEPASVGILACGLMGLWACRQYRTGKF